MSGDSPSWIQEDLPDDAGVPIDVAELELIVDTEVVWTISEDRVLGARRWLGSDGLSMVTVDVLDQDRTLLKSSGVLPNADTHEPVAEVVIEGRRFALARMRRRGGAFAVVILTFQEVRRETLD